MSTTDMPYAMSAEDREIQATARAFIDQMIPYEVEAEMNGGRLKDPSIQKAWRKEAIDLGLYAMNMPKSLGGSEMTMFQQTLVSEQLGRVTNALGWAVHTPAAWMPSVATPEQIERWLIPTIKGDRHECYAITEENAGSDVDAIESTARRNGDEYVLNGLKMHVTSYNEADYIFFQAKLVGGDNDGAHAMFVLDHGTPGVEVERIPAYTHTYADEHPLVRFTDVRIPVDQLIGEEGDGMGFTYEWFRYERQMIAARCCGAADRLIHEASDFAQSRVQFGEPIGEFQAIQFMLADSVTELWAARLMTYELARGIDRGVDMKVQHAQCSMAKLYASEMAGRVADRAVQIFGGRGYMRENVAERFWREVRVDRIWEGTSEIQRVIIAAQLYKRGLDPLVG